MIGFKPLAYAPIASILATTISVSGVSSPSVAGNPQVKQNVAISSIASDLSVGSPRIRRIVKPTGIAAAAATGQPSVRYNVELSGIGSTSNTGQPSATMVISAGTIVSTAAIGEPSTTYNTVLISVGPQSATGSPTIVPGPVTVAIGSVEPAVSFGEILTTYHITLDGVASGASTGQPTVIPGSVEIETAGIGSTASAGQPTLVYVITGRSVSRSTLVGSPVFINDPTLTFDSGVQDLREFAALSETIDPSRVSPFVNSSGDLLYYGSVICHGAAETTAERLSYVRPSSSTIYDPAGIVAGQTYEGRSVPDGEWGYRYVGGIVQARVLGDSQTVAGTVLIPTANQYYLVRDPNPGTSNAFVLKEDHTTATEELKLVHVKLGI